MNYDANVSRVRVLALAMQQAKKTPVGNLQVLEAVRLLLDLPLLAKKGARWL